MILIYLDESGNTGNDLENADQPIFMLCAMLLAEENWMHLEQSLSKILDEFFPGRPADNFEIHATSLRAGKGPFDKMPMQRRVEFRDRWMSAGAAADVKLFLRAIEKKRYRAWQTDALGSGVSVNPHVAAFVLLSRRIDDHLQSLPGSPRGMFISDENREVMADVEKSIRALRGMLEGPTKLKQIIEKGFFIQSHKSLPLQLCDLFTFSARKLGEQELNAKNDWFEKSGIEFVEKMALRSDEKWNDVIGWLTAQQK